MSPNDLLVGAATVAVLCLALVAYFGLLAFGGDLMSRTSRLAVVAGGVIWCGLCAFAAFAYWTDCYSPNAGDDQIPRRIAAGFWAFACVVGWITARAQLRSLRIIRDPKTLPRPALPAPLARPQLPPRNAITRIK